MPAPIGRAEQRGEDVAKLTADAAQLTAQSIPLQASIPLPPLPTEPLAKRDMETQRQDNFLNLAKAVANDDRTAFRTILAEMGAAVESRRVEDLYQMWRIELLKQQGNLYRTPYADALNTGNATAAALWAEKLKQNADARFAAGEKDAQGNKRTLESIQTEHLNAVNRNLNNEDARRLMLGTAIGAGFSAAVITSLALAIDRAYNAQVTAFMSLRSIEFARELMRMMDEYLRGETERKYKEDLQRRLEQLREEGLGAREVSERDQAFREKLERVNGLLHGTVDVPLISVLYWHSQLHSSIPLNPEFAVRPPQESRRRV